MSITFEILGDAGKDNAALVRVDTGQSLERLLFDCGERCLDTLTVSEVQAVDHLLFSHLHMDHVAGFDSFFRATYDRTSKPNSIWGPPETIRIIQHRFQGFMWNLVAGHSAAWEVCEIHPDRIERARFLTGEQFAQAHPLPPLPGGPLIDTPAFSVEAIQLDHHIPSMAYIVREKPRQRIDPVWLAELGLRPGPWLQLVKAPPQPDDPPTVLIENAPHDLAALRAALLIEVPGESLAYLTDFLLDDTAQERLVPALRGCTTLICESQYRHDDLELARRHYHLTAAQAADLARRAEVGELVLFHLSERYQREGWREQLAEARAIFPNARFATHWRMGS
ncbi:MAG: MBL fold metallo-hydrolase [Roseiflexaceae bacterium]